MNTIQTTSFKFPVIHAPVGKAATPDNYKLYMRTLNRAMDLFARANNLADAPSQIKSQRLTKSTVCGGCLENFPTRNQLFRHLQDNQDHRGRSRVTRILERPEAQTTCSDDAILQVSSKVRTALLGEHTENIFDVLCANDDTVCTVVQPPHIRTANLIDEIRPKFAQLENMYKHPKDRQPIPQPLSRPLSIPKPKPQTNVTQDGFDKFEEINEEKFSRLEQKRQDDEEFRLFQELTDDPIQGDPNADVPKRGERIFSRDPRSLAFTHFHPQKSEEITPFSNLGLLLSDDIFPLDGINLEGIGAFRDPRYSGPCSIPFLSQPPSPEPIESTSRQEFPFESDDSD